MLTWQDQYETNHVTNTRSRGWVYIARCESMKEGILKIGCTINDPNFRAQQLSASTSAATPFHIIYSREVDDCFTVEKQMHAAFADRRVSKNREFFAVSLYEASRTLDSLSGNIFSKMDPPTPFAELFASFPDRGDGKLNEEEIKACRKLEKQLNNNH